MERALDVLRRQIQQTWPPGKNLEGGNSERILSPFDEATDCYRFRVSIVEHVVQWELCEDARSDLAC